LSNQRSHTQFAGFLLSMWTRSLCEKCRQTEATSGRRDETKFYAMSRCI